MTILNETGEKYGYSTKTYNLLALALLAKQDFDRAFKIFETALLELKLETAEGQQKNLYPGNNDLAALLVNYIKCNTMKNGSGMGLDFFKSDPLNLTLIGFLG